MHAMITVLASITNAKIIFKIFIELRTNSVNSGIFRKNVSYHINLVSLVTTQYKKRLMGEVLISTK
jgi:hypothetical protein